MKKPTWRLSLASALGAGAGLLGAMVLIFQDNIAQFLINPRTPFQISSPPAPPEYGARGAWIVWPAADQDHPADVFYVHSTTYYSNEKWNAPLQDPGADATLRNVAAPNEAGPFFDIGNVYGPRYRQATLFSFFTQKYEGVAAREFAYQDVREAFRKFLETVGDERPIILAGYEQGGLHLQGILLDFFQGPDNPLRKRLAAAYIIGQATPPDFYDKLDPALPPCRTAIDFRCIVSYVALEPRFDEEMRRARMRSMYWSTSGELVPSAGAEHLCVNPLSWTPSETYIGPEAHQGAASATGVRLGLRPPAVSRAVGARCDDGVLVVDRPAQGYLRRADWFGAKWKAQPFNLFYYDLAANAAARVAALEEQLEYEAQFLQPISDSVDLGESPVNKVPD